VNEIFLYVFSYFLGSIPFGLVFTKLAGKGDIRHIGSGNIGTTNVLRAGSKILALLTLLADITKGALVVGIAKYFACDSIIQCVAGGVAILAHIFPIWLKFKGGKGVATAFGVYLALCPIIGILTLLTWVVVAKIGRVSSLSALIALFMAPIYSIFLVGKTDIVIFTMLVYFLIAWTHRENIKRLLSGKESKF
jgi:glycerol-3-phosphate acyltransferase PlsY